MIEPYDKPPNHLTHQHHMLYHRRCAGHQQQKEHMEIIETIDEQRTWHHDETPTGQPSAAAYRTGCKCDECRTLHNTYMRLYHQKRVDEEESTDGTTVYHNHKGRPSPRTATRWGCRHPRCLHLAGLYIDHRGTIRRRTGDTPEPAFGVPEAPAA